MLLHNNIIIDKVRTYLCYVQTAGKSDLFLKSDLSSPDLICVSDRQPIYMDCCSNDIGVVSNYGTVPASPKVPANNVFQHLSMDCCCPCCHVDTPQSNESIIVSSLALLFSINVVLGALQHEFQLSRHSRFDVVIVCRIVSDTKDTLKSPGLKSDWNHISNHLQMWFGSDLQFFFFAVQTFKN